VAEMAQFQETVQKLVDGMNGHASKIEAAKLKALGQRNRVESEKEVRKRKTNELQVRRQAIAMCIMAIVPTSDHLCDAFEQSLINEKKALLERLQLQYESLKKVDGEQKGIIEKLSNNEA
jgi:hypothetical protein